MHAYIRKLRASVAQFEEVAQGIREAALAAREQTETAAVEAAIADDNLTTISGVGPAVAAKLIEAGIRTYSMLARATDEELDAVCKGYAKKAASKDWRGQAVVAADLMGQGAGDEAEDEIDNETPDKLTEIGGIGPSIAKAFANAGIRTFHALADLSKDELEDVTEGFSEKAGKGRWQQQAMVLAARKDARTAAIEARMTGVVAEGEDDEDAPKGSSSAERITAADIWCLLNADRTDLGNTDRMLVHYGHRILDVVGLGVMAWTGTRWVADGKEGALERTAHEAARSISRDIQTARVLNEYRPDIVKYLPLSKTEAKIMREGDKDGAGMVDDPQNVLFSLEDLSKWANQSQSQKSVSAMVKQSRAYMQVDATLMDAQPHILGVKNGMVDLRSGTLLPADPAALISKQAAAKFDAAAQCPNWIKFLKDVFNGNRKLIAYVKRWIGYILTGETREQKFLFLTGQGSNGKGVITYVIERLLNDYAKTLPKDYLMKQRGPRSKSSGTDDLLAGIRGARYIHASEGDADDALDEGKMKGLSGEGTQIASFKFERAFEFQPVGKLVFDTNFRPRIHSQDKAIWRRVVNIVFSNHYESPDHEDFVKGVSKPKDPMLRSALINEMPGILAWAVEGAVEWYADGLGEEPDCVREARSEYRVETDATGDFFAQCVTVRKGAVVQAGRVYKAYKEWVEHNAVGFAISARAFGDLLKEKGHKGEKRGGVVVRHGLMLSSIGDDYADGIYTGSDIKAGSDGRLRERQPSLVAIN
ncbi:phage/plasmid primase, P4 family [Paracoccus beibuensis]|uniref:phage/plasmid primase, P4 family n=1 Tax=Paracoccus beibuensis TaxID=547602 RepID=UPI00223F07B2|nr:phage/plasmid primase, P4 family [Paracoccus beibuensis]